MSKTTGEVEAERRNLARLHLALGRFIFEFSQLEFMIRHALGAALDLTDDRFFVITSPYDFAALCNVTKAYFSRFCGCNEQDKTDIEVLLKGCLAINDKRVQIVHGTWFIDETSSGATYVSRHTLEPKVYYSRTDDLDTVTAEVRRLKSGLVKFLIGPTPPKQR